MSNFFFILGADDPEMSAIESLLRACGQEYLYANSRDGQRVRPGNAYEAVVPERIDGVTDVVLVECGFVGEADWLLDVRVQRVDHHRPGDPGYGKPPAQYWQASSIGQVARLLGVEPTPLLQIVAAADHCLAAAYAGQCPGVNPKELRAFRVAQRAAFQKRTEVEIEADIHAAESSLEAAPRIEIGGVEVADLRGAHVPELPEAACIAGLGYVAEVLERDGCRKVVIGGCGAGTVPGIAPVQAFISEWASAQGLTGIYGDSVRGYAGGYCS